MSELSLGELRVEVDRLYTEAKDAWDARTLASPSDVSSGTWDEYVISLLTTATAKQEAHDVAKASYLTKSEDGGPTRSDASDLTKRDYNP
tara:strand:- start:496 stop:765 length:270 start_codon:yes stop_codon:yes gene_type:complete